MSFFKNQIKKTFSKRNFLHPDNAMAMASIFLFLWSVSNINLEVLNPIGEAFEDVSLTDALYSKLGKNKEYREQPNGAMTLDTNIVIINVGYVDRFGISEMIRKVNECNPKVVALDVFFRAPRDYYADSALATAFEQTENLVLVTEGFDYNVEKNKYDSVGGSWMGFNIHARNGLANMVTEDIGQETSEFNVCRKFIVESGISGMDTSIHTFAVEIAEIYAPDKVDYLKQRGKSEEFINFIGNIFHFDTNKTLGANNQYWDKPYYQAYEYSDILSGHFDPDQLKDKIVLFGFLGANIYKAEGEDKFYTPLNEKYIGKAKEDMYGIVVHANILSTILKKNYVNQMPEYMGHILGLIFVYLTFASFRHVYMDHKVWYDGLTKFLAILLSLFIIFVIGLVFDNYNYEIKFGAIYIGVILLSGDWLEIYYGLFKNLFYKIRGKFVSS